MTNSAQDIALTTLKTEDGHAFRNSGWVDKNQRLFSVSSGVDITDALGTASDLLDAAMTPVFQAGMGESLEGNQAWLAHQGFLRYPSLVEGSRGVQ